MAAPELRCQQTVEPLARAARRSVHVDERLAADSEVEKALEVLPSFDDGPVVLCTHAETILGLLRFFELGEAEARDGRLPCRKGSIWVLQGFGRTPTSAIYLEPVGRAKGGKLRFPEAEEPALVRAATLDLGSTSFNLLIADATPSGEIRPVVQEKVMLRLGAVIASNATIPEDVVRAGRRGRARALRGGAPREGGAAAAGGAPRRCARRRTATRSRARIGSAIGTPVRILSGEEEAGAIFRALQARIGIRRRSARSASTSAAAASSSPSGSDARGVEWATTLPLGVVRLHGRHVKSDPDDAARGARHRRARALAAGAAPRGARPAAAPRSPSRRAAPRAPSRACSPSASAAGAAAARCPFPADRLAELRDRLVASSHRERLRMRGVRRGRADLLPTGAIVLATVADALGLDGFTVSDWGLREGVMLEALRERAGKLR